MKRLFILLCAIYYTGKAQTLTQSNNEPSIGNVHYNIIYDSVGVVPKTTGTGQIWDFSYFTTSSVSATNTFTFSSPTAYPPSQGYPGASFTEFRSYESGVNFWNPGSNEFRWYGVSNFFTTNGVTTNFKDNPLIVYEWPINFGTNNTATSSGSFAVGAQEGTITAVSKLQGSGTGTLILPINHVCPNVLQTIITQTFDGKSTMFSPTLAVNIKITKYEYYHSTIKFPIVTIKYSETTLTSSTGPTVTTTAYILMNTTAFTIGLNELNFNMSFDMYPNPTKDNFSVNLSNASNDEGIIEIYNKLGQLAKREILGTEAAIKSTISVADLKPGIYIIKTTLGTKVSNRKLIIE